MWPIGPADDGKRVDASPVADIPCSSVASYKGVSWEGGNGRGRRTVPGVADFIFTLFWSLFCSFFLSFLGEFSVSF